VQIHFEENQFEQGRADGRKLLKNNAVPSIFACLSHNSSDIAPQCQRLHTDHSYYAPIPITACTVDVSKTACGQNETVTDYDKHGLNGKEDLKDSTDIDGTTARSIDDCVSDCEKLTVVSENYAQNEQQQSGTTAHVNSCNRALVKQLKMKIRRLQREVILYHGYIHNYSTHINTVYQ